MVVAWFWVRYMYVHVLPFVRMLLLFSRVLVMVGALVVTFEHDPSSHSIKRF